MSEGLNTVLGLKERHVYIAGKGFDLAEFDLGTRARYMAFAKKEAFMALANKEIALASEAAELQKKVNNPKTILAEKRLELREEALAKRIEGLTYETWTDDVNEKLEAEAEAIQQAHAKLAKSSGATEALERLNAIRGEIVELKDSINELNLVFLLGLEFDNPQDHSDELKAKLAELKADAVNFEDYKVLAGEVIKKGLNIATLSESSFGLNRKQRRAMSKQKILN